MAESDTNPPRKHRVIHVNPEAGPSPAQAKAPAAPAAKPKAALLAAVGLLALAAIGGGVWFLGGEKPEPVQDKPAPDTAAQPETPDTTGAPDFISAQSLDKLRLQALSRKDKAAAVLDDNRFVIESLLKVEKAFAEGEKARSANDSKPAWKHYQNTVALADQHDQLLAAKQAADRDLKETGRLLDASPALATFRPDAHRGIIAHAKAGEDALKAGRFAEAANSFADALAITKALAEELERTFQGYLAEAEQARQAGDSAKTLAALEAALSLRPGDPDLLRRLESARKLDRTAPLLAAARQAEKNRDFAAAQKAYAEAAAVDPELAEAKEGAERAGQFLRAEAFGKLADEARALQESGRFDEADAKLAEALAADPSRSAAAAKLREENARKKRDAAVQALLREAYDAERRLDFTAAAALYGKVLALDPANTKAIEGGNYCRSIAAAASRYQVLSRQALELRAAGEFVAARQRLGDALASKPSHILKSDEITELELFLKAQAAPVEITLTSDERTSVSLTGQQFLGMFKSKTLTFMPGDYKYTATRRGYKDVAGTLQIRAGGASTFEIKCGESLK